jgi:hypothetical protein
MDNDDNYPYGRYVKVQNCPIHGWEEKWEMTSHF